VPIEDESNPQMVKQLERLREIEDTKFESFDTRDEKRASTVENF